MNQYPPELDSDVNVLLCPTSTKAPGTGCAVTGCPVPTEVTFPVRLNVLVKSEGPPPPKHPARDKLLKQASNTSNTLPYRTFSCLLPLREAASIKAGRS